MNAFEQTLSERCTTLAVLAVVALCLSGSKSEKLRAAPPGLSEVRDTDVDDQDIDAASAPESPPSPNLADDLTLVVFGRTYGVPNPEQVDLRLETSLRQKIESVSRGFELSRAQEQKLVLAGRGDIKRFHDRVEMERRHFQLIPRDAAGIGKVNTAASPLQQDFRLGPFGTNSLFAKTIRNVLTAEQFDKLEAIQAIEGAGGSVKTRQTPTNDVIEVRLTGCTNITDEDLAPLRQFPSIQILAIDATPITDAGLVNLNELTSLRVLNLSFTAVTGTGLAQLRDLADLRVLDLSGTKISSANMVHLNLFPNLRRINLEHTPLRDAGLLHLRQLRNLEILSLGLTEITDAGLAAVSPERFANLERLEVSDTRITDAALSHLAGLTKLKWLEAGRTNVTDSGVAKLKQALPDLNIHK